MKRTLFCTLMILTAALTAVSCQKSELTRRDNQVDGAVGFNAYTSTATTKGTIIKKTDVQADGIGVFAFYQAAISGQPVPFNTRRFLTPAFMYNQQVEYNGAEWTYTPVKYWPNTENDLLSFFAYAPYKENRRWDSMGITTNSNGDKLNVTFEVNEDLVSQEDILWATPQINQSNKMENGVNNTSRKVLFNFKHVTSKVDLMVGVTTGSDADAWNDSNTEITVKSIVFDGLNTEFRYIYPISNSILVEPATVDYSDGKTYSLSVEPDDTLSTISEKNWGIPSGPLHSEGIFTSDHVVKYGYYYSCLSADQHLFLSPQILTDQTVTITYVVKTTDPAGKQNSSSTTNTITKKLGNILPFIGSSSDRGLESGKSYILKFLIGLKDVSIATDIKDWDADIVSKEIYVPANFTVTAWQNGTKNPAVIDASKDLCINVRDVTLNSTNSNFYLLKDYSGIPYALNELTSDVLEKELAKSKLDPSESDLRFTKVGDANITYVTANSSVVFETATMCVAAAGLTDNGVYVFEYLDPSGLKSYALVKVGTAPTTTPSMTMTIESGLPVESGDIYYIDSDRQFTVEVTEGGTPVAGLRPSCFLVTKGDPAQIVTDALTIVETSTAGTYQFTTKSVENQTVYTISLNSNPVASMKIKVQTYSFDPATLYVNIGVYTASITLKLGDQIATGCTGEEGKGYFSFEGVTGISVSSVNQGVITLSIDTHFDNVTWTSDAKMIGTKNGVKVVEAPIKFIYPGTKDTPAESWGPVKHNVLWWAPVNCGYDTDHRYGKLYQWGRYVGGGYSGETGVQNVMPADSSPLIAPHDNIFYTPGTTPEYPNIAQDWYTWSDDPNVQLATWPRPGETGYLQGKTADPCPTGWRVPLDSEMGFIFGTWMNAGGPDGLPGCAYEGGKLFLPAAGYRDNSGNFSGRGSLAAYWSSVSSSSSEFHSGYRLVWWIGVDQYHGYLGLKSQAYATAVRCVLIQPVPTP